MTGIWSQTADGWRPLAPVAFGQEKELHDLIERSPGMLPLACSPRVVVLGREFRCGTGYADLVAVEADSGCPVVIEIKLFRNAHRRTVLTQVLGYAAYLRRLDAVAFEDLLGPRGKGRFAVPSASGARGVPKERPISVGDLAVATTSDHRNLAEPYTPRSLPRTICAHGEATPRIQVVAVVGLGLLLVLIISVSGGGGLGPGVTLLITAGIVAWTLFQAPVWCGAVNRKRGREIEYCRNNSSGLLLGCTRVREHRWQKLTSAWWSASWRDKTRGLWSGNTAKFSTATGLAGVVLGIVSIVQAALGG